MFDSYTLKARFFPIVILFIPIIVIGIFYSLQFETMYLLLSSIGIVGALMYLFSQLGRDQGKLKEKKLWESWGGPPTTQLLRLRNDRIDKHTKMRYFEKLHRLCPVNVSPNLAMENNNNKDADDVYIAWTKFLISKTRDVKTFPLLLKDNTSYGFRRNVWGLKPHGLILTFIIIAGNYFFWVIDINTFNPITFPDNFKFSTMVLFIILFFWMFVVTKNWVKLPAFSYGERLLECVEAF